MKSWQTFVITHSPFLKDAKAYTAFVKIEVRQWKMLLPICFQDASDKSAFQMEFLSYFVIVCIIVSCWYKMLYFFKIIRFNFVLSLIGKRETDW